MATKKTAAKVATKKVAKTIARSAKTGKLVSKQTAKEQPETTVVETLAPTDFTAAIQDAIKRATAKKFKVPKNLAQVADLAYELRAQRLAINNAAKVIDEREKELREHLINNLPKSEAAGITGKVATARIERDVVPTYTDKAKFMKHVQKTGEFDLITTGLNSRAIRDRWDNKKKVPGIGEFQVVKLSLMKA